MVDLFDLRTIFLAKHAQHVVLIHFPIALFITGVLFDFFSRGKTNSLLAGTAYLNLFAAAIAVLPTIITGVLAWQLVYRGAKLEGLLLRHFIAALITGFLIIASWWIHWQARRSQTLFLPRYRIPIELLGVAVVTLTGYLGGFLSGVNR